MTSMASVVSSLAAQGEGGDRLMGHLTPGDVVIPKEIQTPQLKAALQKLFSHHKIDSNEFTAGHPKNKRNKKTGAPEFDVSTEKRVKSDEQALNTLQTAYNTPGDPNYQNPQTLAQIQQIQGTIPGLEHKAAAKTSANEFFSNPIVEPLTDVALSLIPGGAPFIPLVNAGETLAGGGSLGQAALAGGEAFAGQELVGALANQFPGTANSLGISDTSGNILTGNPSWSGPGTIGGSLSGAYNGITGAADSIFGTGAGGTPTGNTGTFNYDANGNPVNPSVAATAAPTGLSPTTPAAAAGGGGTSGGGGAAPPSVASEDYLTQLTSPSLQNAASTANTVNNAGDLSTTGSPASSSNLPGTPSVQANTGNSGIDSLVNSFSANQATNAPVTDALNPSVIAASNAATPGGTDPSLNQQGFLSNTFGGTSPVPQSSSLASAGNAANAAGGGTAAPQSWGDKALSALTSPSSLISAGGLALSALKGGNNSTSTGGVGTGAGANLASEAAQQQTQGAQLEGYLQSGTLPAGLQAGLNQQLNSAIAAIKSRYASMGLSGSSAEQQDIANAQAQAQAASAQQAEQLLSVGINETGMSSQLYNDIIKNQVANDTGLSSAIANFAAAAGGGGLNSRGGINIQLPAGATAGS
jgi:hypothetical protein